MHHSRVRIAEPGAGWEVVQLSVTDNLEQWTAAYVPYTYIGPYNLSEVQPMRARSRDSPW